MAPDDVRTYYSAISYPEQSPTLQSRIRTLSKAPSRPHFCGFCYIGVSNLHLRRPSEPHPLSGPGIFSSGAKCMESTRVPLRIMVSVDLIRSSGNEECDTTHCDYKRHKLITLCEETVDSHYPPTVRVGQPHDTEARLAEY